MLGRVVLNTDVAAIFAIRRVGRLLITWATLLMELSLMSAVPALTLARGSAGAASARGLVLNSNVRRKSVIS